MFCGVVPWKSAGGEGRMAGKLLLQRYLLPQSLGKVCIETCLSREERQPLLLHRCILPLLHMKSLDVILVSAIFYSEQRNLHRDLVRAVFPPLAMLVIWRCTGFGLLNAVMHLTFSWYISSKVHTNQAESLALCLCVYLSAKRNASLQTFFHCWILSYVCNLLTILHVGVRTASVIIALTDGELQDVQFYYAEQEVSHLHVYPD